MAIDDDGGDALEQSFEDFFRTSYSGLVRSLSVAAGNQEVAADCVQEAFCRAYARWRRISRYDAPAAWVRRVAVNLLIDHERGRKRAARAIERLPVEPAAPPTEPGDLDLAAVLSTLPPQQRIAAALFYVDDMSVGEVAAVMKLSSGAVKFHLHQARASLRPSLQPYREDVQ